MTLHSIRVVSPKTGQTALDMFIDDLIRIYHKVTVSKILNTSGFAENSEHGIHVYYRSAASNSTLIADLDLPIRADGRK